MVSGDVWMVLGGVWIVCTGVWGCINTKSICKRLCLVRYCLFFQCPLIRKIAYVWGCLDGVWMVSGGTDGVWGYRGDVSIANLLAIVHDSS